MLLSADLSEMEVSIRLLYKSNMRHPSIVNLVPAFSLYGEGIDERFPDGLHIETIHARSPIHDWRIKPHRHHDLHQFFWIASGGGTAQIEGADQKFASATALIIPPLTIHGFLFDPGTSGFVVSIPTTTLDRVLTDESSLRTQLEYPVIAAPLEVAEQVAKIEPLMLNSLEEFQNQGVGRRPALLAHATLISLWFARLKTKADRLSSLDEEVGAEMVRHYLRQIETGFRSQLPLSTYAHALGVSVPHLSRVCRRILGCSALMLLHNRIILEARRNLVYTSMTISQIAFALGFSDPAYFTRFFTDKTGCSPSAYRANVLSIEGKN